MVISNWPMWVVGLTLFVDGMDQYIVRGSSDQIKAAFGVGDTAIGLLFSAFILVNGIVTMPAGYLADRWNRTRAMAVTIVLWSVISALGGLVPTAAFGLLVVIRASLGFGQAVTDPSGSSVIADYYGTERRGQGLLHPAVPELRRPGHGPGHRRRASARSSTARAGASPSSCRSSPASSSPTSAGGCPSRAAARRTGPT